MDVREEYSPNTFRESVCVMGRTPTLLRSGNVCRATAATDGSVRLQSEFSGYHAQHAWAP
eukprot:scaffold282895_cov28-Tisochrysis_lutea.AAC.6